MNASVRRTMAIGGAAIRRSLLAALLWAAGRAPADEGAAFVAPDDIIAAACRHSPVLQSLEAEVAAAEAGARAARAAGWASLGADARAGRYEGLEDSTLGPGVTIPGIETRYGAGVQAVQPLYTGGRLGQQRTGALLTAAAARQARRAGEADVVLQAAAAYWTWSKAFYQVDALRAAVARMEAHAGDMRNLFAAGLATESDALATDVLLERTRLQLEEAQRHVEITAARLALLTGGSPPGAGAQPVEAAAPRPEAVASEEVLVAVARTNRAESAVRLRQAEAAEAQVRAAQGELRPQLALVARYEAARPNPLNIPPEDRWQDDAFLGLSASWSVWDWGLRRAQVAEAAARAAQARLRVTQTEDELTLEVREARANLLSAQTRATVAGRILLSAQRNLAAATDLWQGGLARHAEVLDAQAELTDAEFDLRAARADWVLARVALAHAAGRLQPGDASGGAAPEAGASR